MTVSANRALDDVESPVNQNPTSSNQTAAVKQPSGADAHRPQSDFTTDKATASFVRRTLCSHNVLLGNGERGRATPRPIDEVLPPLTSSNEVDLQLYAIISVIIKDFVQTWYSKVTPDHVFVNEILQVIAHCTRALEQRLREVDLEALLLDEIPELIEAHLTSFRLAKQQASTHSLASDPRLIYHTLHPHPALSPVPTDSMPSTILEQRESESAWRQLLVHGVLAILLPTEDLENGCLRALVTEIFAEMILGNGISGKACEGWLLWEAITSIAKVAQTHDAGDYDLSADGNPEQSTTRLERFGLLSPARDDHAEASKALDAGSRCHKTTTSLLGFFWAVVQYALFACMAMRALISNLATSSSLPSRFVTSEQSPAEAPRQSGHAHADASLSRRRLGAKRPIVSMKMWSCVGRLVELNLHMPWLSGSLSMLHWGLLAGPGKVGGTDSVLDRYLSRAIHMRLLNPTFLPVVLRTIRATLFPSNSLGPPRQPPSDEEEKAIKHRCAASLLNLLPPNLAAAFFANQQRDAQLVYIEELLSCLDDTYLNKHLVFQIIELIIFRLVPELGVDGIHDLMEERLS